MNIFRESHNPRIVTRPGLCSFAKATLKKSCPYYKPPGRHAIAIDCLSFKQDRTTVGRWTVYHCSYDPPKAEQLELNL